MDSEQLAMLEQRIHRLEQIALEKKKYTRAESL